MTTEQAVDTAALDAELAKKLDLPCGYAPFDGTEECGVSWEHHRAYTGNHVSVTHEYDPPDLTTGDGMLMVLEAMREAGWLFAVYNVNDGGYEAQFFRPHGHDSSMEDAPSLPTAVTLAALSALNG